MERNLVRAKVRLRVVSLAHAAKNLQPIGHLDTVEQVVTDIVDPGPGTGTRSGRGLGYRYRIEDVLQTGYARRCRAVTGTGHRNAVDREAVPDVLRGSQ